MELENVYIWEKHCIKLATDNTSCQNNQINETMNFIELESKGNVYCLILLHRFLKYRPIIFDAMKKTIGSIRGERYTVKSSK